MIFATGRSRFTVSANKIAVEVAYALPDRQMIISLEVEAGTTALQTVEISTIRQQFPELEDTELSLGVFGKKRPSDHVLRAGDRVEIYRTLIADPKEVRRQRAKKKAAQEVSSLDGASTRSESEGR